MKERSNVDPSQTAQAPVKGSPSAAKVRHNLSLATLSFVIFPFTRTPGVLPINMIDSLVTLCKQLSKESSLPGIEFEASPLSGFIIFGVHRALGGILLETIPDENLIMGCSSSGPIKRLMIPN